MTPRTLRRAAEHKARKEAAKAARQAAVSNDDVRQATASAIDTRQGETDVQPAVAEPTVSQAVISEAQLAANRANAQLSTGAITPEGKARSARNALKHGLTGKTVLLPYEDAGQYQREFDHCIEHYNPGTDEELRLTQTIHECRWRISRVQRLQVGILLKGHTECAEKYTDHHPTERAQLIEAEAYLKYEKQLRNLGLQEARLLRTMEKAVAELKRLKAARQREAQSIAEKPAQPVKNGFDFATPQTNPATAAEHRKEQAA